MQICTIALWFILRTANPLFLHMPGKPASEESSFGLSYNGGKLMTEPVSVSLLWFGSDWQEAGTEAIRNAITSLTPSLYPVKDSDVPTLGDWWEIIRQYRDSSNALVTDRVDIGAECFYRGPELNMTLNQVIRIGQGAFNKSSIDAFGGMLNCTRNFNVNESSIYHVVFSHNVKFLEGKEQMELLDFCSGDFPVEVSAGVMMNMVWARAPQNAEDQCSMYFRGKSYFGPPNGDEKIDSLVGYMLTKIADEVTNRDGRGWIGDDGSGFTVSSSCGSLFQTGNVGPPLYKDGGNNMSFNAIGLNGYRYIVHYIWDQKIRNCALKLSETCGTNAVIFKQPKGYLNAGFVVNHTGGLQPYPPSQMCQWKIHYPMAKFISFKISYFSVAADSDDHLQICQLDTSPVKCSIIQSNSGNFDKNFKFMSSKVSIQFTSNDHVSFESRGWELSYSAGLCKGKEDVYDQDGVIGYTSSSSSSYAEGLSCQWILHGKPGTLVSLSFTRINISRGLDFLAVYNGTTGHEIANFSGFYSGSDPPQLNLTGEVMIAFATQTDSGEGWTANFYIASPVDHDRRTFLFLVIIVVIAAVAVSFSLAFTAFVSLRRRRKHIYAADSDEGLLQIRADINGDENQIGEGPSAIVYRAVSTDGSLVAVKSLRDAASQTDLEEKILLKSSSHPNIISLVGYAQEGLGRRYLVFEFMGRGSLSDILREKAETLDWEKRLTIAIQISSAILMLHIYLKPPVYHGNITPENILLDEFCNAKLGGFGSANYCTNDMRNPEQPSEMAEDIWSFGLLLVELLTGEALVDRHSYKSFSNLEQINELLGGQDCLDRRLDIPSESCKIMALTKFGDIAKWCIGSLWGVEGNANNPKIGDVLSGLKQVKQLFCSLSS